MLQTFLHPIRLTVGLLAISIVMLLFVSVAGMILLTALAFLAAVSLSVDIKEDRVRVRLPNHSKSRWLVLALESVVALGFAGLAFAVVPLGLIFYIGD
jgi:hypothetical protein